MKRRYVVVIERGDCNDSAYPPDLLRLGRDTLDEAKAEIAGAIALRLDGVREGRNAESAAEQPCEFVEVNGQAA